MKLIAALLGALIGLFVAAIGLLLVIDGWTLLKIGGSWYYLAAGGALIVSGLLLAVRQGLGGVLFGLTLLATVIWAVWESGLFFWALMPRVVAPVVIGVVVLIALFLLPKERRGLAMKLTGAGVILGVAVMGAGLFTQFGRGEAHAQGQARDPSAAIAEAPPGDWRYWGRDGAGTRFAPFNQINTSNVDELKVAWQIHTGEVATGGSEDQNTPLQVGELVYLCTPKNQVIAVKADSGEEVWRHNPQVTGGGWNRCRGVGYYETAAYHAPAPVQDKSGDQPVQQPPPPRPCGRRILATTIDARLFALDAATGAACPGFGKDGVVDLKAGMGEFRPSFYFQTSAPTVAKGLVIIGGWVQDNSELQEPSGVVRAFSADTGDLVWAWDLGNPATTRLPPAGKTYTRGTPNVWSTPAIDDALGLVYLPVGNATPDYWGSHRTDAANEYNASVVALDIYTGRERWHFRTVNHDLWDWDVPSQPMLVDFPGENGAKTPALIQLTKRGQIFVLNRATGKPLVETVEREVPQAPAPGEYLAPTQPFSLGMPAISSERLHERDMWGITPLDQLRCRIQFRQARYEGEFTPPGDQVPSLQFPGNTGGMNWGSGAYDAVNGRLIVSTVRMPQTVLLTKSDNPTVSLERAPNRAAAGAAGISYKARNTRFMSEWKLPWAGWKLPWAKPQPEPAPGARPAAEAGDAFNIPCIQPPHGELTAIDLATRTVVWRVPTGTAEQAGPWGLRSGLKIPVGMPSSAGAVTTAGGLVFRGDADNYLRAYDARTGKVLWASHLPAGPGATAMTYVSPVGGKQYVLVSASGVRRYPDRGDYVVAYALPDGA